MASPTATKTPSASTDPESVANELLALCTSAVIESHQLSAELVNALLDREHTAQPFCENVTQPFRVDVLRLDQIHPVLQGNKIFKLLDHISRWQQSSRTGWVTPGGCWSNHLHACAWLARRLGIPVTGLVRGYEHLPLTPMLEDCKRWGMTLVFLDKQSYRQRYDAEFQQHWRDHCDGYFIGEGGALAVNAEPAVSQPGTAAFQWLGQQCQRYESVWMAAGSGTTAGQLMPYLPRDSALHVLNTVQDNGQLAEHLQNRWTHLWHKQNWHLHGSQQGGFGKARKQAKPSLERLDELGLVLDPVYGLPLLKALLQHYRQAPGLNELAQARPPLLIHGGGLQGRRGVGLAWRSPD